MKYAFLNRNFRKLTFEQRVIFGAHGLTALFCFFPWIAVEPIYGDSYWNSAFSGAGGLIGAFIFLISLAVALFFVDKIMETKRIQLPFHQNNLFLAAGVQQLILLVLAWSVLISVSRDFESSELRFGLFACFLVQAVGLVATYLQMQQDKTKQARDFFQHPTQTRAKPEPTEKPAEIGGLFGAEGEAKPQDETVSPDKS